VHVFCRQYKFGARTGLAPVLLGGMKVLLALLFGSSLLQLLQHFPKPLLGALLLVSGLELAASARKESEQRGYTFMLLTAAAIMGLNNTASGFAVGWVCFVFVAVFEWGQGLVQKWWHLRGLQQYKPLAAKDRAFSPV
jgi:MFS superfamily sulfate permease-like transporter